MEEWKEYRVSEIFNIQNGYAFKSGEFVENSDDTYEVLKIGHIEIGGGLRTDPKKTYVKRNSKYKKWVLEKNDIVMGMTDMKSNVVILGIPALVDKNDTYVLNQRVARLSLKDPHSFDIYFCYYQMLWNEFTTELRKTANSGVQVNLTTSGISTTILYVPNYELQRKIGRLLSSFDDKIKNNRKINANLEAQAQALFKSWFVDFEPFKDGKFVESELGMIPNGWRVGTLNELGDIVGGSTPSKAKPEYYTNDGIAWLTPKDLSISQRKFTSKGETDITQEGYESCSTKLMPKGSVLFSSRAPIGYITIAKNDICTNQGFKSVIPTLAGTAFIYCFLKEVTQEIENKATGSTFKEASGALMKSLPTIIPESEVFNEFENLMSPIFKQQETVEEEISRLAFLRETLLPRLMSGELSVDGLKGQFAVSPGRCPGSKEHVSNKTAL